MSGGNLEKILRLMTEKKASDVFLSAKTPILIKINGQIMQLTDQILTPSQPRQLLSELITPQQLEELDETGEDGAVVLFFFSAADRNDPTARFPIGDFTGTHLTSWIGLRSLIAKK